MPKPCHTHHAGRPVAGCRTCWLAAHVREYQRLWKLPETGRYFTTSEAHAAGAAQSPPERSQNGRTAEANGGHLKPEARAGSSRGRRGHASRGDWREVAGWFSEDEGRAYLRLLQNLPSNPAVAEIGVFKGRTAALAWSHLRDRNGTLHLIDCWEGHDHEQAVRRLFRGEERVIIHRMRSDAAAELFEDASLDLVFIDGDHRYESVKKDLDLWRRKVKPGGVLCGHDYGSPRFGVQRAVDEVFGPRRSGFFSGGVQVEHSFWWVETASPAHFAPAMTPAERARLYDLLWRVDAALRDTRHFVCWGGLLGQVRFGELMPWDDDCDLLVVDPPPVRELQARLPGLQVKADKYIKIWDPSNPRIGRHAHSFPFVELNPAEIRDGKVCTRSSFGLPDDEFPVELCFPTRRDWLGPVMVNVPARPRDLAIHKYGPQCLESALPPFWSHKEERATGFPRQRVALSKLYTPRPAVTKVPHTFLINLDRRPDRLVRAAAELRREGIAFERFSAVDGSALPLPGGWEKIPSAKGAYGCRESHRRVLELALIRKLPAVLICEDDVILTEGFREKLLDLLSRLPPAWDAVMLGGKHISTPRQVATRILRCGGQYGTQTTHCYLIRRPYIEFLFNFWLSAVGHCDNTWARVQEHANVFAPTRWLAGQADGESDIKQGVVSSERWW